jgi:hypothetical protein
MSASAAMRSIVIQQPLRAYPAFRSEFSETYYRHAAPGRYRDLCPLASEIR